MKKFGIHVLTVDVKGFNPRYNVYHQYGVIAFICLVLAAISFVALPYWLGIPLFLIFSFAVGQFSASASEKPTPIELPLLVKKFESLRQWWERYSSPISSLQCGEQTFLARFDWSIAQVYDLTGELVWIEVTSDQADWDPDWKYDEPREVTVRCIKPSKPERLSWLALRRSKAYISV